MKLNHGILNLNSLLSPQEISGKNVLLLPVGMGDDSPHSQNEKINVRNYIEGVIISFLHLLDLIELLLALFFSSTFAHYLQTKLLGAYLYECSQL